MPHPTPATSSDPRYRHPHLIGDIAIVEASRREENCERAGQLYLLGEILTALHRQAEALEALGSPYSRALHKFDHIPDDI